MKRTLPILFALLALLCSGCEEVLPGAESGPAAPVPEDETLAVHFIDVGQADSALLLCGGQAMLIDGGNVDDSSLVVSYLTAQGVDELDYLVCTHAHEDHAGGLSGPLNTCSVRQVFSPVTEYDSKSFRDFLTYTEAQGLSPTVPEPDATFALGEAVVTVLGPRREYPDTNDTSIVLRVDYGETSFLFTGDMERTAEADLLEDGCALDATVLKVGHHGSDTSTSYSFLREVMPEYAVISVGTDNSYGHPSEDVLSRLYDAGCTVYRTDRLGSIVAVSDGENVSFTYETDGQPETGREPAGTGDTAVYIGNRNSQTFHRETCPNLPAEQNRIYFDGREAAVDAGYHPCGNCMP